MKQFTITIQDKEGLHARPAGLLSKAAKGFQCAVTLRLPIPPQSHLVLPLGIEPREKRV